MATCIMNNPISFEEFANTYDILGFISSGTFGMVFKVLNKIDDEVVAMKIISTSTVNEIKVICQFAALRIYTDSLITLKQQGIISPRNILEKFSIQTRRAGFNPHIEYSWFYTMPLLLNVDPFTHGDKNIGILFEIFMAIVIINKNGISHGDLSSENIKLIKADYIRQYTINNMEYYVDYQFLPVLIDPLAPQVIENVDVTEFSQYDFYGLRGLLSDNNLPVNGNILNDQFTVLLNPIFDYLKIPALIGGDKIKLFQPITV